MFKKSRPPSGFLIVLFFGCFALGQSSETFPDLVEKTRPSVVSIVTYDKDGKRLSRGTGFVVASNRVITNYHVVNSAFRTEIQTNDRKIYRVTKIESAGKDDDLALLQTEQLDPTVKSLYIATITPRVGDKVLVIGNPLGLTGSVSDGIVSAFRNVPNVGKLLQITAPISPGSSGSPVINMNGEVIGVATSNLEDGQNLNFAVSSETIRDLWSSILSTTSGRPVGTSKKSDRWRLLLSENITYDAQTLNKQSGTISAWIQYKESSGSYDKVLTEINCNTSQTRQVRSLAYDKSGDLIRQNDRPGDWKGLVPDSNGESMYRIFCKDQPDYQYLQDYKRSNVLNDKARSLMDSKDFEQAIAVYSQIIQELPEMAAFGFWRIGLAKEEQGKLLEARNSILEAIRLEPVENYYFSLGGIYEKEKNAPAAIDAYWKSLRLDKDLLAKWSLDQLYKKTNDNVGLTNLYKYLITRGEIDYYDELGNAYEKQGLKALALSTRLKGAMALDQKTRMGKGDAYSYVSLANIYASLNNHTKLQLTLISGFRKFPENFFLASRLAKNYNENKQWTLAVEVIKDALPRMKDAFYKKELLTVLKLSYQALGLTKEIENIEKQLSELK